MNNEVWKNIEIFDYKISNYGRIISLKRNKETLLKPNYDKDGYVTIHVSINSKCYRKKIHRLVAQTFIPNPNNYPVVNHINGIKDDNRVENLEWCTIKHNHNHAVKLGLLKNSGEESSVSKLTEIQLSHIMKDLENGVYATLIAQKHNVSISTINTIRKRKIWIKEINNINKDFNPILGSPIGERSNLSKLKDSQILEIKKLKVEGLLKQKEIAEIYKISPAQISRIVNNKSRKNLDDAE